MVNGAFHFRTAARDFRLQQGDALVQLLHRQGVEILSAERPERIIRAAGQKIVRIHAPQR